MSGLGVVHRPHCRRPDYTGCGAVHCIMAHTPGAVSYHRMSPVPIVHGAHVECCAGFARSPTAPYPKASSERPPSCSTHGAGQIPSIHPAPHCPHWMRLHGHWRTFAPLIRALRLDADRGTTTGSMPATSRRPLGGIADPAILGVADGGWLQVSWCINRRRCRMAQGVRRHGTVAGAADAAA